MKSLSNLWASLTRIILWLGLVIVAAAVFLSLRPTPWSVPISRPRNSSSASSNSTGAVPSSPRYGKRPDSETPAGHASATPTVEEANGVTESDLSYLAAKNLLIPVEGVTPRELRDSFDEGRSEGRRHQAIDIMSPQGTQVLAATDGFVIKLFHSEKGGITLYEKDPSGPYIYYYAHLMRYADAISEGQPLKRGQVIAYVGDTGDAGPGNFHLHFAISKVSSPRQWSGGDPINPYPLLARK